MRKLLTFLIALASVVGTSASSFGGSMMLTGVGPPPVAAGGGPAYVYQGTQNISGIGSSALTIAYTITTAASPAGSLVVVTTGVTGLAGSTMSVVYDPAGANVTLTQDGRRHVGLFNFDASTVGCPQQRFADV